MTKFKDSIDSSSDPEDYDDANDGHYWSNLAWKNELKEMQEDHDNDIEDAEDALIASSIPQKSSRSTQVKKTKFKG